MKIGAPKGLAFAWVSCAAVLVAVVLWTRLLEPVYLVVGAVAWGVALLVLLTAARGSPAAPGGREGGPVDRRSIAALAGTVAMLAGAIAIGGHTQQRLARVATEWPALAAEHRAGRAAALEDQVTSAIRRAQRVVELAADSAAAADGDPFTQIDALRRRADVAAVAVFAPSGDLTVWSGEHRGDLPVRIRSGGSPIVFAERPLFSYLYVTSPIDGRPGHTAAVLALESSLPVRGGVETLADDIARQVGARPDFAAGSHEDASWELVEDGETIVHARFDRVTQTAWRAQTARNGQRGALALAAIAFLLFSLASVRRRASGTGGSGGAGGAGGAIPLALAAGLLAVAPLGTVLGLDPLFSPAFFLLPSPWDVPLGVLLAVSAPVAAMIATRRRAERTGGISRWRFITAAAVVGLAFVGVQRVFLDAAGSPLLQGGVHLWGGLQVAAVVVLATVAALVMPAAAVRAGRIRTLALFGGLGSAVVLGAIVLIRFRIGESVEPWFAAAWALPFAASAYGLARLGRRRGAFLRWVVAGWLAATAVLPQIWSVNVGERLASTERELHTLGSRADPFADYLLRQFAFEVIDRARIGEEPVSLLYRGWVASGLARSGFPARVTLWDADRRRDVELALSGADPRRSRTAPVEPWVERLLADARERGRPIVEAVRGARAGQAMASPLPDGRMISVVVPPRRSLDRTPVIAPFLGAAQPSPDARLTLVPTTPDDTLTPGRIHWQPTERGWRSDLIVPYPDGDYHAHFELPMPSSGVLLARGVLLLALDLGVLALLWLVGSLARGELPRPGGGWTAWVRTFRARVTLALFGFFLLPVALFGATAYRALAGEVTRSGRTMAEHAVAQAVEAFSGSGGDLTALAEYTGHDVLYYYRGELARASSPEAIDLGLYGAWMPPSVFRALGSGEAPSAVETRELGGRPYLVAYRRLPAAGALAVPVSLRASEAATRQRELAHLILFAVLMGAVLSTTLSLAVGRTLARPLGRLRRAAAEVGAGRLEVRLPDQRADEFGELFTSFNHMVRRLRHARSQEVRTARVLAWGEMARQVAHEIKNPLTPIKLSVQHLRRAYRDGRADYDEILDANVEQILAEIEELTEIARAFSRYGLPPEAAGALEAVDAAAVARETLTLYRAAESPVNYRLDAAPGLPPARARRGELREVLLNLLENAREAVEGQGTVTVRLAAVDDRVELSVVDDGVGITEDALPRIFEPQFSTRSSGTGLGLAIVRRLVEGWGGEVAAESRTGLGTTVRVRMLAAMSVRAGVDAADVESPADGD